MTNTTHWLDNLSDMFRPYQTSSGDDGFEFNVLVDGDDFFRFMTRLLPYIDSRAAMKVIYHGEPEREYALLEVDCWDRVQGEDIAIMLQDMS